uniref:Protein P n=1 Tax=Hepatitis B virus TaxID=10407 RepID=A0A8F3HSR7_HBV|nr:MAG: polymerase [Hepatitis B virus]
MPQSLRSWVLHQPETRYEEDPVRQLVRAAHLPLDVNLQGAPLHLEGNHKLLSLRGLYQNQECTFNPEWKIPEFNDIFVKEIIKDYIPSRKWKLLLPAKLYVPSAHYFGHNRAIKNKYNKAESLHQLLCLKYLHELYKQGILYLREDNHHWKVRGPLYSWEVSALRDNGECGIKLRGRGYPSFPRSGKCSNVGPIKPLSGVHMGSDASGGKMGNEAPTKARSDERGTPILLHGPGNSVWRSSTLSNSRGRSTSRYTTSTNHSRPQNSGLKEAGTKGTTPNSQNLLEPRVLSGGGSLATVQQIETSKAQPSLQRGSTSTDPPCRDKLQHGAYTSSRCRHNSAFTSTAECSCTEQQHSIRCNGRIPDRVTGGIFLVDKSPRNTREARLVVDFSQFSRWPNKVQWPSFASPNLRALSELLPPGMSWVSLDVSAAFYHIPVNPAAASLLLVGIPGLPRDDPHLWELPESIFRDLYLHGRDELLLLLHQRGEQRLPRRTLGFRKIPMGIGLSPFLLSLFSSILVQFARREFVDLFAFSYMDDLVLGARTETHLASCCDSLLYFFREMGIKINEEKTRFTGTSLFFLGLHIRDIGILPQEEKSERVIALLEAIDTRIEYDFKIIQRLIGHLAYLAPFTRPGYPLLMPLYHACNLKRNYRFDMFYKYALIYWYSKLYPVRKNPQGFAQVFVDATPTSIAYIDYQTRSIQSASIPACPIHVAELMAVCWAKMETGASIIATDNTIALSKKFTKFPWELACLANALLIYTRLIYIRSKENPADLPSRGIHYILPYPQVKHAGEPQVNHLNLKVFPTSPPQHTPSQVRFLTV